MRGSKRPKPGGKWELRVPLPKHPLTGERRQMSRTVVASEREADVLLARLIVEVAESQSIDDSITLRALHQRWISHLQSRGRSPSTITSYNSRWRVVEPLLGNRKLSDLTTATFDALYSELLDKGKGTATVVKIDTQMKTMLGQARKWRLIRENPVEFATPPTHRPNRVPIPDIEEFRSFLSSVHEQSPELSLFVELLFMTGARKSELLATTWSDVHEDSIDISRSICEATEGNGLIVKSTKTGATGRIGIGGNLIDRLATLRSDQQTACDQTMINFDQNRFIFSDDPYGMTPWRPSTVSHRLSRARRAGDHGNACTAQAMRALCASELNSAGISDTDVRDRLLQSSVLTTRRHYIRPSAKAAETATEILSRLLMD